MTPKQKKLLKYVGFPIFYLVCLVLFVRLTFPYETLRRRILAEYNRSTTEKYLEIERLSGHGLFGVEAEGIRLSDVVTSLSEAEAGPPQMLAVEEASVSISMFSYLFGNYDVSFSAKVGGGNVEGSFFQDNSAAKIVIEGEHIDISGLTLLSAGIGLPLGGELGGKVDLLLPEGQMKQAAGSFDVQIENLTAGDGKAKIRNTIALPKLNAGNLVLKAKAVEGRLDVEELTANGKDFEMKAEGKFRLREPFDKSTVSVDASFKFKEAYTTKSDLTKSLFGSPDSPVPALFDMDPTVKRAKQPDGSYAWSITGQLARPSFNPGRKRGSANAKDD